MASETKIGELERLALDRLAKGYNTATHWITTACGFGNDHAKTRRLMRRMERAGLVQSETSPRSGRVYWWRITDDGLDLALANARPALSAPEKGNSNGQ